MKRWIAWLLCAAMVLSLAACGQTQSGGESATLTGKANGFGGVITATVTTEGGKITAVSFDGPNETPDLGGKALETLAAAMTEAGSVEVDLVAGATVTSNAAVAAVNNALDPEAYPYEEPAEKDDSKTLEGADLYHGLGIVSTGRQGPGSDDQEVPVYSFNTVAVQALFDGEGKIVALNVDQVEVATPNYDGDGMPHFTGYPGKGGYNYDENHDAVVDSVLEPTDESFLEEIASWQTKRERGDGYQLGSGTWTDEMNAFEQFFVGMTVDEVEAWFAANCSDSNGRPLKITDKSSEEDKAKFDALSEDEQAALADLTASATMSLRDGHGDILSAIRAAYDARKGIDVAADQIAGMGLGVVSNGRQGPGSDDQEVPVYSFNTVFAATLLDADGKLLDVYVDQVEVATPNYDGDGMPHFSGWPGQDAYNYDENHDAVVDGTIEPTDESFLEEVASWQTKRERGDGYQLGSGTWTEEMDAFEAFFAGKTMDEIEAWFAASCSDGNGRPLKITDKSSDEDKAKFDALTEDEQAVLADLTAGATMSLRDAHGDILTALTKSVENARATA